jgi:hypothetical protein
LQHDPQSSRGMITWHTSDDDGTSPDCGQTLGFGDGWLLWIGEISKSRWAETGGDEMNLGGDGGHWIILYGPKETHVIGRCAANADVSNIMELLKLHALK